MELSEAIRQLRERQGLTQEAFANSIRFAYPTVNRWENGKAVPDGSSLRELLRHAERLGAGFEDVATALATASGGVSASPAGAARRRGRKLSGPDYDALPSPTTGKLDLKAMEGMLWKAACSIRGEKDAPKFKDYILPLMFLKRLSDVFEDEIARLTAEYGDEKTARAVVEADHSVVRFYIPEEALWPVLSGRREFEWKEGREPKTVGERVTSALRLVARLNARLQGVIDIVDFNETRNGEREISDQALSRVIELLSEPRYRLGLTDVEPDFLGRAYEYLLRKFAEGQGQSAGEFFTPKEVGWLIAHLVDPRQGEEVLRLRLWFRRTPREMRAASRPTREGSPSAPEALRAGTHRTQLRHREHEHGPPRHGRRNRPRQHDDEPEVPSTALASSASTSLCRTRCGTRTTSTPPPMRTTLMPVSRPGSHRQAQLTGRGCSMRWHR